MWLAIRALLVAVPVTLGLAKLAAWPLSHLFIELGWVHLTWHTARFAQLPWRLDRAGGATFAAAWALHRQPTPAPGDVAWLRQQLAELPLTAAVLAAWGLLAAARGDRAEARAFLMGVRWFDRSHTDALLRTRAIDWLVADAASHGDWPTVLEASRPTDASNAARVLGSIAKRQLGHPDAPSDLETRALRDMLPAHRQPPSDLLERAAMAPPPTVHVPEGPGAVQAAVAAHLALESHPTPERLAIATERWEQALSALDPTLVVRAAELGAARPESALAALRSQVETALAELADAHRFPLGALDGGGVGAAAGARRREDTISAIELAAEALHRRLEAERRHSPLDEAREWLALVALYREGTRIGGEDLRRVTFRTMYEPLSALSVDLHNVRGERALSNAITRYLLFEARVAHDRSAIELQERNLRV